jgi:phage shock protein C
MMEHEPWRRRRLLRSTRERMWAGVAGGLAEYFEIDPTLMRLLWVVATVVTAGLFVAVYIVMWVIMPLDSDQPGAWREPSGAPSGAAEAPPEGDQPAGEQAAQEKAGWQTASGGEGWWRPAGDYDSWYGYPGPGWRRHHRKRSAGAVLIVLGLLFLSAQVGLFRWINGGVVWAVVLIVLGMALLMRRHDWRM